MEQAERERLQIKVERDNSNAEQRRSSNMDIYVKKLNAHNAKVADVKQKQTSEEEMRI